MSALRGLRGGLRAGGQVSSAVSGKISSHDDRPSPEGGLAGRVFEIDGQRLTYPTSFRDGSSIMQMFLVPTGAANEILEPKGFEAAEIVPGKAVMLLICVHYTDTDCGVYEEIAFALFTKSYGHSRSWNFATTLRHMVRGDIPSFTWRLAVTTILSRDSGIRMWGFPKTKETIEYEQSNGRVRFDWENGGQRVVAVSVPDRGTRRADEISPPVYSVYEGRPHVGYLTQSYREVGYHWRGATVELGDHPIADELRRLGLPKRPLLAVRNGGLTFSMSAPQPL